MRANKIILTGTITTLIVFSMISLANITLAKNSDSCSFSHKGSHCYGHDTSKFPKLPKGQHYGTCEEVGDNNELACDIDNNDGTPVR